MKAMTLKESRNTLKWLNNIWKISIIYKFAERRSHIKYTSYLHLSSKLYNVEYKIRKLIKRSNFNKF